MPTDKVTSQMVRSYLNMRCPQRSDAMTGVYLGFVQNDLYDIAQLSNGSGGELQLERLGLGKRVGHNGGESPSLYRYQRAPYALRCASGSSARCFFASVLDQDSGTIGALGRSARVEKTT